MSSGRYSKPLEPYRRFYGTVPGRAESKSQKLDMTQNLFRMWRDFPDLRFSQFLSVAVSESRGHTPTPQALAFDLFYVEDDELERACYRYWVHHSGRRIPPAIKERWA